MPQTTDLRNPIGFIYKYKNKYTKYVVQVQNYFNDKTNEISKPTCKTK